MHNDLIARIESGEGDDDTLSWAVQCFVDPSRTTAPRYMSSIDAALTLLPEGCEVGITKLRNGGGQASVCDRRGKQYLCLNAPTPARAITAACLRAGEG